MNTLSVTTSELLKVHTRGSEKAKDLLVCEEPLEIRVGYGSSTKRHEFALAVTMRTPGADEELARGFMYSEGIVQHPRDIVSTRHCMQANPPENTVKVELREDVTFDPERFKRNFYTSSSCGICGKAAIESLLQVLPVSPPPVQQIYQHVLLRLTPQVNEHQNTFKHTGGLHAASLFDLDGKILIVREDIGRHNALDKLIGVSTMKGITFSDKIVWLSGRVSFEMIQKSFMVGIKVIVALGAPSSLAVALAIEHRLVLIGFLKKDTFNIYSGRENIILDH